MKPALLMLMLLLLVNPLSAPVHKAHYDAPVVASIAITGIASFYGEECAGKLMANGKPFDPSLYTAASYDLPMGSHVMVRNLTNGRTVDVVITDRGPNHRLHRLIDLSEAGAYKLGYTHEGITLVAISMKEK
jgi:rare lipoprotein A